MRASSIGCSSLFRTRNERSLSLAILVLAILSLTACGGGSDDDGGGGGGGIIVDDQFVNSNVDLLVINRTTKRLDNLGLKFCLSSSCSGFTSGRSLVGSDNPMPPNTQRRISRAFESDGGSKDPDSRRLTLCSAIFSEPSDGSRAGSAEVQADIGSNGQSNVCILEDSDITTGSSFSDDNDGYAAAFQGKWYRQCYFDEISGAYQQGILDFSNSTVSAIDYIYDSTNSSCVGSPESEAREVLEYTLGSPFTASDGMTILPIDYTFNDGQTTYGVILAQGENLYLGVASQNEADRPTEVGYDLAINRTPFYINSPDGSGDLIAGRYQPIEDGEVIRDVETGLEWQRCSLGQTWTGTTCSGTASTYSWSQAQDLSMPGGFRVPKPSELDTLVFCPYENRFSRDGCRPVFDAPVRVTIVTEAFPNTSFSSFPERTSWNVWSDREFGEGRAFALLLNRGDLLNIDKDQIGQVRLVRVRE